MKIETFKEAEKIKENIEYHENYHKALVRIKEANKSHRPIQLQGLDASLSLNCCCDNLSLNLILDIIESNIKTNLKRLQEEFDSL